MRNLPSFQETSSNNPRTNQQIPGRAGRRRRKRRGGAEAAKREEAWWRRMVKVVELAERWHGQKEIFGGRGKKGGREEN